CVIGEAQLVERRPFEAPRKGAGAADLRFGHLHGPELAQHGARGEDDKERTEQQEKERDIAAERQEQQWRQGEGEAERRSGIVGEQGAHGVGVARHGNANASIAASQRAPRWLRVAATSRARKSMLSPSISR